MAIRSNTGNVITNAVQIASVGATTASGFLRSIRKDNEATKLLNKKEEEKSLNPSTYSHAKTKEEAKELGELEYQNRLERARRTSEKFKQENIDNIIDEDEIEELRVANTDQGPYISEFSKQSVDFLEEMKKPINKPIEEIISEIDNTEQKGDN